MARRFRSRGRSMRSYGGRRSFRRSYRGRGRKGGMGGMLPFIGGAALGYIAPRMHPMQDLIITTLAVLPVRLPYGIKKVSQGYVMGMIVKNFLPSVGGIGSAPDNFTV